ncbi:MAG: Ig-like domain-containing protein [Candidatus Aminicenantes bacterium]|nr:Ig-like domain-containing protein [Candidatus Aminicenantes bacterium]
MMKINNMIKQIKKRGRSLHYLGVILLIWGVMFGVVSLHAQDYANDWLNGNLKTEIDIRDAAWVGSHFIGVGLQGVCYVSSNGYNWTKKNTPLSTSDHLFGVGYDGVGTVVAVGRDEAIIYSEDQGDTWKIAHPRNNNNVDDIYKVAYGSGKFVAQDEGGGIWTSADGKTGWSKYMLGSSARCIAFANGYFMIGCAGSGAIFRSATGEQGSWSNVGSLGEAVRGIAYGNNKWLAVGRNIATAGASGTGWTTRVRLVEDYNIIDQLYCCATAPDTFIAAGEHGFMLNSDDGITWREGNAHTKRFIFAMNYGSGANVLVGVGNGGPRGLPPEEEELQLYAAHYSPKGGTPPPILTPGGGGGSITVTSPKGGEKWQAGQKYTVTWTSTGDVGNVNIDYSIDARKTWMRVTSNRNNSGSLLWPIPPTPSTSCFVKVSAVGGSPSDTSNSAFSIIGSGGGGTITVTSPNGGERWIVGQPTTIKWTSTGSVGLLNIDYSTDGMETWNRLTSSYGNSGSLTWKRVADVPSTNCYVQVWDISGSPADVSNGPFTIARSGTVGTITLTSPNGGEKWDGGSAHDITWTSKNVTGTIKIEYTANNAGSWNSIGDSAPNSGKFTWTVPEAPSTLCKVRLTSVSDGSAWDTSSSVFTILSGKPPKLDINRHRFNYGYIIDSASPTGAQAMIITNVGGKTLNWLAVADQSWISLDKTSGTGDAVVQISAYPSGLAAGDYTGTIAVSDSAASNSPDLVTVNLKVKATADDLPPFGEMATPVDGATVYGSIPITGWVLDDVEVQDVKLYYNEGSYIGQAIFVEGARSDVAAAYSYFPKYYRAGWGYMLLTNSLPDGAYTITAIAADTGGKTITFGPKTITIDNAHSGKPFGAIDTPAQGGTISGSDFKNWGWALTPQPNMIAKDGSTIQVWIDGTYRGTLAGYNGPSGGIEALFPGLKNSGGPTGYFEFDSTAYANGLHLISWTVSDDGGNSEGIGSRFFSIYNTESAPTSYDAGQTHANAAGNDSSRIQIPTLKKNYNPDIDARQSEIYPPEQPTQTPSYLEISELQRIEIPLCNGSGSGLTGRLATGAGADMEPLPSGSSLDTANGIFRWQPGPGFLGDYELAFTWNDGNGDQIKKTVHIRIVPQFPGK